MAEVYIAIKPKYPTRQATDKVLFNDGNFLTIINEKSVRQLSALLATSFVSLVSNGKYYPVDVDNFEAQYALLAAGSTPTVAEDENFGVRTLDYFASATTTAGLTNVQDNVEVYTGIARAKLFKVVDYSKIGKSAINKNGFWFVFKYDLTGATSEGYTNVKFFNGDAVVNGDNYLYLGTTEEDVSKYIFTIKASLAVNNESGDAEVSFKHYFTTEIMNELDATPAIAIDGVEYASLANAFSALNGKGGTITINKSFTESSSAQIVIDDGKEYTLKLLNGAAVTIKNYFHLKYGTFNFTGEGTVQENTPTNYVIALNNTDEAKYAHVNVAKGITLKGWFGIFAKANTVNSVINCAGTVNSQCKGTDNGAAITVNGTAKSALINFTGSTEGSLGFGMYIAGVADVVINGGIVSGTDGGIEQRAGTLTITNGARISTSSTETPTMTPNGNGTTSVGCAIAIAQHTTKKPITVNISDVVATGPAAFMEGNPQENPSATADTSISISGGSFMGLIKTLTPATDCTKFLNGGRYSSNPDAAYIADGYEAKVMPNGNYEVVKA